MSVNPFKVTFLTKQTTYRLIYLNAYNTGYTTVVFPIVLAIYIDISLCAYDI
jgi:hypothetical protein